MLAVRCASRRPAPSSRSSACTRPATRVVRMSLATKKSSPRGVSLVDKGIVEPEFVAANLKSLHVLDASWYLPKANRNPKKEFDEVHIAGAQFFDIDEHSDKTTDLPHMLPKPDYFAKVVGGMGIGTGDAVVVYDGAGIFSAPRLWWTFRIFGHDNVAVLNGGLPRWRSLKLPIESGPAKKKKPAKFEANFRPQLVVNMQQVIQHGDKSRIVDARSAGRFKATEPEPRPGLVGGHIPDSKNVPFDTCLDPQTKETLLPPDQLRKVFAEAGIADTSKVAITSCGSGMTACVPTLALFMLGNKDVAVYDGSWAEYGALSRQTPKASS